MPEIADIIAAARKPTPAGGFRASRYQGVGLGVTVFGTELKTLAVGVFG